jgi:hypothetical protein
MNSTAISNNNMMYLRWHFGGKILGCFGFTVRRHQAQYAGVAFPAMVGFPGNIRIRQTGRPRVNLLKPSTPIGDRLPTQHVKCLSGSWRATFQIEHYV